MALKDNLEAQISAIFKPQWTERDGQAVPGYTLSQAKEAAPRWDIYFLEQKWRSWMADGGLDAPRDPDKAFIGFCRKYYERNGAPK